MTELKEIALQKIGRNVVNFQKIEGMLKLLISHNNFKAPISKIAETLEERKKAVKRNSFGKLTNEYYQLLSSTKNHIHEVPNDRNEAWVSFSFQMETEDGLPQHKAAFSFLVSERNRLIHQMLISFNPDSTDSCKLLIQELDEQNKMIQREYKNIQTLLLSIEAAKKELLTDNE